MTERRADALCALLLVAIATLFFADVLFRGTNFYFRDVYPYHMPVERAVRAVVERGELPLWNRLVANGQPMAANPAYEVFYPPQWLTWLGDFERGFALHILLHVYLALLGMFALLRALALRRPASTFGALSFGLGGFLLGTTSMLPTFFSWAWAPLIGVTLLRLLLAPTARRFAVAAVIAAMPLLIDEPFALLQIWLMVLLVTLAYTRRRLPLAIGVAIAAALIAAVQFLPMLDFIRDSARARGLPFETVVQWSMQPLRPLELFAPRIFGIVGGAYWGGTPYLASLYAGVFVTILAISGWFARVRGARVAGALAAVSYLLAIGRHTPLWGLLYAMGLRSLRYPEKFAAMGVFAMIVLAALVADAVDRGDGRLRRVARAVAVVVLALAIMSAALMMFAAHPSPLRTTGAVAAVVIAMGWLIVLHLPRRIACAAGLVLLLVDLGSLSTEVAPRMPASFFTRPALVEALDRDHDAYALFDRGAWAQQAEGMRYEATSPGWFARNALRPYTPALWGLRSALEGDTDETALTATHDLLDAMRRLGSEGDPRWSEPFMTMANVRYVLDYRPLDDVLRESGGHPEVWRPVRIRRVADQGRYWFARSIVPARSQDEMNAALRRIPDVHGIAFTPWPPLPAAPARIVRVRETANDAQLDVEASAASLLVITVTRHRYWRATIDGTPSELRPANIAFQALVTPAGRHHIEMRYRNPMIFIGAAVSGAALLAALVAMVVGGERLVSRPD